MVEMLVGDPGRTHSGPRVEEEMLEEHLAIYDQAADDCHVAAHTPVARIVDSDSTVAF